MPTTAELETQIDQQFPNLAALYRGIPDLWNILLWCVAAGAGAEQTQEAIINSKYYKSHNDNQLKWAALAATDPGQAVAIQKRAQQTTMLTAQRLGVPLTHDQLALFSQGMVENGWTDQELEDSMIGYTHGQPLKKLAAGDYTAAMTKIRNVANDYAMPVTDKTASDLASRYLIGGSSANGIDDAGLAEMFKQQAKSLYPTLGKQLDAGITVKQWAQPYTALAAQELEISPDAILLSDPKWKSMLEGTKDPKTGVTSPMTLSEWQAKIRQGGQYGYDRTTGAKDQAAQLESGLAQRFGATG